MGTAFTAPADRGAGQQAEWRPLSLYEAEYALCEEIEAFLTHIRHIRDALRRYRGANSPVNYRLDALEERIQWLEVAVDHARIRIIPGEDAGP